MELQTYTLNQTPLKLKHFIKNELTGRREHILFYRQRLVKT